MSTKEEEDKQELVDPEEGIFHEVQLKDEVAEPDELTRAENMQQPCPESSANFFSRMTFWWFNDMVKKGYSKPLQIEDMYKLRPAEEAEQVSDRFEFFWNEVKTQASQQKKTPSLLLAIHRAFGLRFYLSALLKIVYDISELSSPLFIKWIIQYMQDTTQPIYMGYVICAILFVVQMVALFSIQQYFHVVMTQGMRIRTALRTTVYKKTLNLSSQARQKLNTGDITNFMSIDSAKVGDTLTYLHMIWSAIFQISVCLFFLFQLLGWSAIAGLVVMIILIPLNIMLTRFIQIIRRQILKVTGERIKIINEILQGIRVIKFYAWEGSFLQKTLKIRSDEIAKLTRSQWIQVLISTVNIIGPLIVSIATFMLYAGLGNNLDPAVIFPALSYLLLLRFPMMFFPSQITGIVEAKVSLDRINNFLLCDEVAPRELGNDYDPIVIKGGVFTWEDTNIEDHEIKHQSLWGRFKSIFSRKSYGKMNEDSVTASPTTNTQHNEQSETNSAGKTSLRDINVRIPKGKLTCVVGAVGSGKSSLLQAIVGEMKQIEGETIISGSVAYTTQQAWIQNATVKNNITFGMPFNSKKYHTVISCCALEKDIHMLPAGDKTEIGEKGINLSGGQRQRVSLARAVYSDTDIILLDDPLSAVDAHVGKHIFEKCLCGILKNKTRVLATHQLHYLKRADNIILLSDGQISEQGTYDELMKSNGAFAQMIQSYTNYEEEDNEQHSQTETCEPQKVELKKNVAKLIQNEERVTGTVKSSIYKKYINYGGGWLLVIVLGIIFVIAQIVQVANNWWLAMWSEDHESMKKITFYLLIYSGLGVAGAIFQFIREILFTIFGLRAAYNLHEKALANVAHAPTSFFDTTPVGRIINRFSKDTESTDSTLIATLKMFINGILNIFSIFAVIVYATPLFIIPLIPICILYYRIQQYYRHTSREIQRLESIHRSPLFAHFSETLSGLSTIRAYDRKQAFQVENWRRLDTNNKAAFCQLVSTRWLGFRLEFVGRFIVFIAALLCVISRSISSVIDLGFFTLAAGVAGLSLSYASQITGQLNWTVRMATDTEAAFSSVERVLHYCEEIEQEADMIIRHNRPPQNWPDKGEVKFDNVVLRYRKNLDPVLNGLSVNINGGEKIGIVGRTGAGKSTLMIALFRLVELDSGSITIDGINVSQIGLEDLRSRIAIIPQDPVLFSGTIRFNLDPFNQYDDAAVWKALERVHIRDRFEEQQGTLGLQTVVSEGGDNFSVGERQLICIARALLRRTKVLVMDEATANVDLETDTLIQQTIRTEFTDRTVFTIAHRLNTIIDSDKILVMDKGQLAEFEKPSQLLMDPTTIFSSLVNETGRANANFLKRIAMGELDYMKELSSSLATRKQQEPQE